MPSMGFPNTTGTTRLVKQAMIRSAKEVILVADATKFGKVAFAHVAGFRRFISL